MTLALWQPSDPAANGRLLWVSGFDWLQPETHSLGLLTCAGKGSGKSFATGTDLMARYYLKGVGQVLIETTGGTCDYFLDKLLRLAAQLPPERREQFLSRIVYQDMSAGNGIAPSCPLYYRLHSSETLYSIAQRPVDLWLMMDSKLHDAPIMGANSLKTIASYCGMILAATGCQITEALSLLDTPSDWQQRGLFDKALNTYGEEVRPAVDFFKTTYHGKKGGWSSSDRQRNTSAFRSKVEMFALDQTSRAIYGQSAPLPLDAIADYGLTVIRDYRFVRGRQRRQFALNYDLQSIMDWAGYRELRGNVLHLIIEELSEYTRADAQTGTDLLAQEISYMLQVEARNKGIRPTILLQSISMVSPAMQKALLSCGNLCLGYQDIESALILSQALFPYERPRIKRTEPIFMGSPDGPMHIADRQIDYTIQEGEYLGAAAFTKLPGWSYLVRRAYSENTVSTPLIPMRVTKDVGLWPDKEKLEALRKKLGTRHGQSVSTVLNELALRTTDQSMKLPEPSAIVPDKAYTPSGYRIRQGTL